MKFLSVCSGIEAASVAWGPLGWKAAGFSEIEPFPAAVLKHHYPGVINYGDMTALPDLIRMGLVDLPDVLCGGTPCQAFSVAGLRRSLDDERGNLSLTFCEIANAIDDARIAAGREPGIVFWENVPGVLSTKDNAFGCFLAGLAGEDDPLVAPGGKWTDAGLVLGPQRAVAWRVLDAQYFGLAQRRKRVFVVASARDGFDPAAILFEREGVRRDTAPSREAGEAVAPTIAGCANGGGANVPGRDVDSAESLQVVQPYAVANCLTQRMHKGINTTLDEGQTPVLTVQQPVTYDLFNVTAPINRQNRQPGDPCHTLARSNAEHAAVVGAQSAAAVAVGTDCFNGAVTGDVAATMGTPGSSINASGPTVMVPVAFDVKRGLAPHGAAGEAETAYPLAASDHKDPQLMRTAMQVRRLTPVECERLQGFPDHYTAIPWRKKSAEECPDGPRYKALGNSWAVPVVRWIGQRINAHLSGAL